MLFMKSSVYPLPKIRIGSMTIWLVIVLSGGVGGLRVLARRGKMEFERIGEVIRQLMN